MGGGGILGGVRGFVGVSEEFGVLRGAICGGGTPIYGLVLSSPPPILAAAPPKAAAGETSLSVEETKWVLCVVSPPP